MKWCEFIKRKYFHVFTLHRKWIIAILSILLIEVPLNHLHKLSPDRDDISTLERSIVLSCDIDLELWSLGISGDKYPDICIFRFSDTIHDATHDSDMCRFEVVVFFLPHWHFFSDTFLHIFREDLELVRARTTAPRTAHDLWLKCSKSHRLEDISTDLDLERAWSSWLGSERYTDRISYPLLEEDRERCSR